MKSLKTQLAFDGKRLILLFAVNACWLIFALHEGHVCRLLTTNEAVLCHLYG